MTFDLVGWLLGGLINIMGTLVGRVLISLGLSYTTYSGIDTLLENIHSQFLAQMSTLSGPSLQIIGVLQIGTSVNILVSAISTKLLLSGITSGAFTKFVLGNPA